jgi:hypothetical protein
MKLVSSEVHYGRFYTDWGKVEAELDRQAIARETEREGAKHEDKQ